MSVESNIQRAFSLIHQLQGALAGNRIVRGTVSSAGAVQQGAGFTVVKNGTGDYTIKFTRPFSGTPTVTATQDQGGTATFMRVKNGTPITSSAVTLQALSIAGALTDCSFGFTATGPA